MGLKTRKLAAVWFISACMVLALVGGAHAFSNVLAFGDSLSDNGRNDTDDPFGIARLSNGPVWVEYLAADLGAPLFDMAFAGATTSIDAPALVLNGIPEGATSFGLQWQVGAYFSELFLNYGPIADDTLITISAGGNDMFNNRDATTAANNVAGAITSLIAMGGDAFMVMNLSPSQQPAPYQEWMAEFNTALAVNIGALHSAYTAVDFYLLDLSEFVAVADHYDVSFLENYKACTDGDDNTPCYTTGTFAWFDEVGVHPTTQVHQQIAELAAATNPVPEPATFVLLLSGLAGLVGLKRKIK